MKTDIQPTLPLRITNGFVTGSNGVITDSHYNHLLMACKGLIGYRRNNELNFQLEKVDDYLKQIEDSIRQLESL